VLDLMSMAKFKCKGVDQATVNADLRERFGATVTRQDLLSYREETGIDPKWIRRNAECRTGRGLYSVPGADAAPSAAWVASPRMAKHERPVMETPFDSGDYDDTDAPVVKPKRGRKAASDESAQSVVNQPDYNPLIHERDTPQFIHAWVCDNRGCVGRKPGEFYPADDKTVTPTCECGSTMSRHSWTRKTRI